MKIVSGARVLHYEVSSSIGKGGMGEVFRAKDTKLGRDVAIKVLPEEFTKDAERIARFEREARLLASLSHSNVAAIHGVEDVDGVKFLVMELAAGENLSDRMMRGPIPIDDAIEIALQIADALEAAHEKGIVHRDLKPANIKVDEHGRVQVLDFGLAKALESEEGEDDYSNSPTMVRAVSHHGIILGTAAYMSPEQARGKRVDRRADVWAFGVILWEMITGTRLFRGETLSDTLAAVLREEPDWKSLPPETPAGVRRLLRRCLTRNPKDRLRDIGDAKLDLREAMTPVDEPSGARVVVAAPPVRRSWLMPVAIIAAMLGGIAIAQLFVRRAATESAPLKAQLSLPLPSDAPVASGNFMTSFVFSPDGEAIAYVGVGKDGVRRLYVRRLDEDKATLLPGTEGAEGPFFSPDGQWVGFWSPWKVRKVRVSGAGVPEVICDAVDFRGGAWAGNTIIFTPGQAQPLLRVPDSGGEPAAFTRVLDDEGGHRFPQVLPDGDTILFPARPKLFDANRGKIVTVSLSSGERKDLGQGSADVRFSPTGHLLYVQEGRLIAVPFDVAKREITGPAKPIVENVVVQANTGAAQFAVSSKGHLAWVSGGIAGDSVQLVKVDRSGSRNSIFETTKLHRHPSLSPDDRRVLYMVIGPDVGGLWTMSTNGTEQRRLTQSPGIGIWASGGRWVSNSDANPKWKGLYVDSIDGAERRVELFTLEKGAANPSSVSTSGVIAYTVASPVGDLDAWYVDPSSDAKPQLFLGGPNNEGGMVFSPDGRFVAYVSDRTGQFEVYVTTFPDKAATWQVSTAGGSEVVWRRDGREIFFRSGQDLVSVPVTMSPAFHAGSPAVLFQGSYEGVLGMPATPNYAAAADGSWFLMIQSPELDEAARDLRIAIDWPAVFGAR